MSGPAIILLHGWGGSARSWDSIEWPDGTRVFAVDLPGHGARRDVRPANVRAAAARVEHELERFGEPVILVGHSLGGQVSAIVHTERPDLVRAECVINPAYGHPDSDAERMRRWREEVAADPQRLVADFIAASLGARVRATTRSHLIADVADTAASVLLEYLDGEYFVEGAIGFAAASTPLLARRSRPVLGLYSDPSAAAYERSAGNAEIVLLQDRGHYPQLEDPAWFVRTLGAWLDRSGVGEDAHVIAR